ncbi:MAG: hypothetical protein ACXVDW_21245, partial [Bacteroidia bacterium]
VLHHLKLSVSTLGSFSFSAILKTSTKSLPKSKVANFIWYNKSIDCDTWHPMNHNFDSLLFGNPLESPSVNNVRKNRNTHSLKNRTFKEGIKTNNYRHISPET